MVAQRYVRQRARFVDRTATPWTLLRRAAIPQSGEPPKVVLNWGQPLCGHAFANAPGSTSNANADEDQEHAKRRSAYAESAEARTTGAKADQQSAEGEPDPTQRHQGKGDFKLANWPDHAGHRRGRSLVIKAVKPTRPCHCVARCKRSRRPHDRGESLHQPPNAPFAEAMSNDSTRRRLIRRALKPHLASHRSGRRPSATRSRAAGIDGSARVVRALGVAHEPSSSVR